MSSRRRNAGMESVSPSEIHLTNSQQAIVNDHFLLTWNRFVRDEKGPGATIHFGNDSGIDTHYVATGGPDNGGDRCMPCAIGLIGLAVMGIQINDETTFADVGFGNRDWEALRLHLPVNWGRGHDAYLRCLGDKELGGADPFSLFYYCLEQCHEDAADEAWYTTIGQAFFVSFRALMRRYMLDLARPFSIPIGLLFPSEIKMLPAMCGERSVTT